MSRVRVKGFKMFADRYGKMRCYHRATGTPIDLEKCPIGSVEFIAECSRIAALSEKAGTPKAGTLGGLISAYRAHPTFRDLAPRTRSDYQRHFDYLKPIADTPLTQFTTPFIVKLRDKAAKSRGRHQANYMVKTLSPVFRFGVERGMMKVNPAFQLKALPRNKNLPEANRPWKDYEREVVMPALPLHMRPAAALMMYCALDPQDALTLPRTAVQDGMIDTKRGKTGEGVWLPVPAPVLAAIEEAPPHDAITLCANSRGRPWTVTGYGSSWQKVRNRLVEKGAVEPGLTLKGLRHTVATILAELGMDDRTIADFLGQKTIEMAQHYSKRANRTRKNTATAEVLHLEMNRRSTEIVKPGSKSVKLAKLPEPDSQ